MQKSACGARRGHVPLVLRALLAERPLATHAPDAPPLSHVEWAGDAHAPAARPNISLFFPVYRDELTVEAVTQKALETLRQVAGEFEIVIVDDGSPDRCGAIADELARRHPQVTVVHHPRNLGYGQALKSGFRRANRYEWVCFTDGDDQYDLRELHRLAALLPHHDAVATFRWSKIYGPWRRFVSGTYNALARRLFGTPFRDASCGLKLVRRSVIDQVGLLSDSPFAGAEVAIRASLAGFRVAEAGISTYPRRAGRSSVVTWRNMLATWRDMRRVHRDLFRNVPRSEAAP